MQKDTLCRAFSGLLQTYQPQKAKKMWDSGPRAGKSSEKWVKRREMSQRNKFHTAVHKLRSKTMIVGNINIERLQLNHILVPHGSKKMHLKRQN